MKKFSLFEGILIGLASFGIGGLTMILVNRNKPVKYNCNIQAILEPNDKQIKNK